MRILFCLSLFMTLLFLHVERQNDMTELQLKIPALAKEVRKIEEETTLLKYRLDRFENPRHLMELMASCDYSHLKHPVFSNVLHFSEGIALNLPTPPTLSTPYKIPMLVGATR